VALEDNFMADPFRKGRKPGRLIGMSFGIKQFTKDFWKLLITESLTHEVICIYVSIVLLSF
jgi:hypothetical protein